MKIKKGFVLEQVGNGYLAVAVGERASDFSGLVRMNGTGAFLWNLLAERDMSHKDLVNAMLAEYDVDEARAAKDISAFEEKLIENGILE